MILGFHSCFKKVKLSNWWTGKYQYMKIINAYLLKNVLLLPSTHSCIIVCFIMRCIQPLASFFLHRGSPLLTLSVIHEEIKIIKLLTISSILSKYYYITFKGSMLTWYHMYMYIFIKLWFFYKHNINFAHFNNTNTSGPFLNKKRIPNHFLLSLIKTKMSIMIGIQSGTQPSVLYK